MSRCLHALIAFGAAMTLALAAPPSAADVPSLHSPLGEADRARLRPPAGIVDVGNAAPLIRYSRTLKGGAHTHGAWNGGWQVTHALAVWADDAKAEDKLREQIAYSLEAENCITANGGYTAQHERHITGAYAILRHAPRFWSERLTEPQRAKIDLLMRASLVASAYTTSDATYADGARPTALDGDTNLHRGWNPNFREGMFGGLLVATVYFGGADRAQGILDAYDHDAFVAELAAAGLANTLETFTWAQHHPEAGAPTPDRIEASVRGYRLHGGSLPGPFELYRDLTLNTYGGVVACGLNDGEGIVFDRVATGTIVGGCDGLPNKGKEGMLLEFASKDAKGPRSAMSYSYDGFRANLTHHAVALVGGYWPSSPEADTLVDRLDVGITDLAYKLEHGYRDYSKGSGSTDVFDLRRPHWDVSFRTALPLWTEVFRPYHASAR